ncbi:carbon-nitrogen hydrolase family protein [Aliikangiella sp. IMCC44359]|uniref:carbon-nitrogen hydrolase family protein n=1 Tax=Aliikangiella sp. IMCC44359 TaxID=3459125 RepID=UPI00403A8682
MININELTVAAIQLTSGVDLVDNMKTVAQYISEASKKGAQLVVLPEYFGIMGKNESAKLKVAEEHLKGEVQQFLSLQAKQHQVWLVAGSHPVVSAKKNKPYGRCYVYSPEGECICWYDKIHLFDVHVADNTNQYSESKFCTPGNQVVSFDTSWGKIGIAICYDLRFPELFRELVKQGVKIMVIPAAFTAVTGEAHWEVLLRTRAIENQIFVVAAAQAGLHDNGRETWGHSCIISPWGEVLAVRDLKPGLVLAKLDLSYQQKYRNEFPVLSHTRL